MKNSLKIFIWILLGLLCLIVVLESRTPTPVDWRETYSIKDKIPFGTYIFYQYLKDNSAEINLINNSPYEFAKDSNKKGTYILIDRELFIGETATKALLDWVDQGNTLFLSAEYADFFDLDTLKTEYQIKFTKENITNYPTYNFANPNLKQSKNYSFISSSDLTYFSKIDTLEQTVLGWTSFRLGGENSKKSEINFLEIPFGKGKIFMHSSPKVFTNIFLLGDENYNYAEKILGYFNLDEPIFYDVYFDYNYNISGYYTSPLYVILENKHLKWGYYLLIIGTLLFIFFEGKRKQQIIPIIEPVKNKSYEYVRSIAGIYLTQKDHLSIAHKVIEQFLEYIRAELRTPFDKIDSQTIERLSILTEISETEIADLFGFIKEIQNRQKITKQELKLLNQRINNFKRKT